MARLGRYFLADQPLHVIQRGNNRGAIFFAVEDYARYHDWLAEAAGRYFCRPHAYVLMTNHVHLLVTPQHEERLRMIASLTLPNGIRRAARRQRSNRPCPKDPKDRSDRLT